MLFLATNSRGLTRAEGDEQHGWQVSTLLPGQRINCLAANPLSSEVVYAGTQGDGVLRSDDHGMSWRSVGMAGHIVKSLAVSPHLVAGMLVSLLTPRKPISREEALRILDEERAQMDVGTQVRGGEEG